MTNGGFLAHANGRKGSKSDRPLGLSLTATETIDLVRRAVEKAKEENREALAQEEEVVRAVDRSVNVDLKNQGLGSLPEEAVEAFQADVERYGLAVARFE